MLKETTQAARRVVADTEELVDAAERETGEQLAADAAKLATIAELLPALDEASIAIGILTDHLLLVRTRLDAVRRRLHAAIGSRTGSTPPPPLDDEG